MHDAELVRSGQRAHDRHEQLDGPHRRHARAQIDQVAQCLALEKFEDHVRDAAEVIDLVDDDDVVVGALRGRLRLDQEALGEIARCLGHELDRDAAAEPRIARSEHHTHTAATELADQLVLMYARTRLERDIAARCRHRDRRLRRRRRPDRCRRAVARLR